MRKLGSKSQQNTHLTDDHFSFRDMLSLLIKSGPAETYYFVFQPAFIVPSMAFVYWQLSFQRLHPKISSVHSSFFTAVKENP